MIIRKYQESDRQALLQLIKGNTPKYFHENEWYDYMNYLEEEVEDYFVMDIAGRVVGAGGVNYFYDLGKARISWDVVDAHLQGKGYGSLLLKHRIAIIEKDPEVRYLEVRTTQKVFEFYKKNDFKLVEIERDFWAPGFDLYLMHLLMEH